MRRWTPSSTSFSIRNFCRSPFGNATSDAARQFSLGAGRRKFLDGDAFLAFGSDFGDVLVAVGVKERQCVADIGPHYIGDMVGLIVRKLDLGALEGGIYKKTIGQSILSAEVRI